MKRPIAIIATLSAAGAIALATTADASTTPPEGDFQFTVVVSDPEATVTPADLFIAAPVQNVQGAEDAPVYQDDEKVGLAETVYNVTRVEGDDVVIMVECSVELPDGNVLFNGTVHFADVATGAAAPVVGGTGLYAGARGTVVIMANEDGSTTLTFDFTTN